ncbi:GNAT family N-acetyltransferase [Halobacillus trueperi]|uniref:Acetyltransferase (GNAT) family protein n=2 Tax=Halobacillus TaxID=45667 RepID=A0A1H0T037_HALAD|nr:MULTISPECIES: GNAT family N-acetyltransferase [Halobacillus]RDY70182.1 GNAT family N-acetyltransferase [Halobacillus trueperi]SDP46858.1 Acetyltransferase (GNAT) family protein [Halobacillus aidingensis]
MNIAIRNAERNDYESLLPLFRQVHNFHVSVRPDLYIDNSNPVEQEFFERQLDDGKQHIFVATISGNIVGVIVTKEEETMENFFVKARNVLLINSLSVDETHRKKGNGKKLTEHVFDFGRGLKVDSIELGVSEQNTSAIEFYRSIGMTTKSRKMEMIFN